MAKSKSAKVLSEVLELFSMYTEKNGEKMIADAISRGETPTPPPKFLETRYEDLPNGRVFYANDGSKSGITVFYLHGGAYFMDITDAHWKLLKKLVDGANVRLVVPAYRLLPFATYREAFDLVVPLYRAYREANPDQKVILMGDSAGGGLSLAVTEQLKADGVQLPDELVLLSPWVDIAMDNEQIGRYESRDPFLSVRTLSICAEKWRDGLDAHDWHVSPIYGSLKGIRNVTVFVGTSEIFFPDVTKFFRMLDRDPSNELIVGDEMNHVYPLFPIPEAKPAVNRILQAVAR